MPSVTYTLETRDLGAVSRWTERQKPILFWSNRIGLFILIPGALILAVSNLLRQPKIPSINEIFEKNIFLLAFLALMVFSWIQDWRRKMKAKKSPTFGTEIEISLGANGVRMVTINKPSFSAWDKIFKITEDKNYVFIFGSEKNALYIPKRAFPSPADAEAFVRFAITHWGIAHPAPIPIPIASPTNSS